MKGGKGEDGKDDDKGLAGLAGRKGAFRDKDLERRVAAVLDYDQLYPTTLPVKPPPALAPLYPEWAEEEEGEEEWGEGAEAAAARFPDLAITEVRLNVLPAALAVVPPCV